MALRLARWARGGLLFLLVAVIGAQFVRPDRTNPPVNAAHATLLPKAPADVRAVFDRACRDCHSNETRWPLYSQVAPMSWLVASDVHEGRDRFNYSEWSTFDSDEQDKLLGSMCTLAKKGRMPLPAYLLIHRGARLAPGEVTAICAWSEKMRDTLQ